jgi:aryl-alcohol dehydrogenase-like predicted oxidoreductase
MRMRRLGASDLEVSEVGLGCNNFGMRIDEAETRLVVDAAIAAGINLFDTADIYGGTQSEVFLGRALGSRRKDVVVATKFGMPVNGDREKSGGSRRWIMQAAEDSLRRLGTDYIDLYQLHQPDPETPIEETLRALEDLVQAGKVRFIGNSNFSGWQISEADGVSRAQGLSRFVSAQNLYSILERKSAEEVLPACERLGLGFLPYFPLASGLLTGKYRRGQGAPQGTRSWTSPSPGCWGSRW